MSQQFGNQGRKPGRPSGGQPSGSPLRGGSGGYQNQNRSSGFRGDEEDDEEGSVTNLSPRKPGGGAVNARSGRQNPAVEPLKVEPGKRIVALMFDSLACYLIGMALTVIPFIKMFITLNGSWVVLMLVRDYFFEGRGVGKNMMGLQVVDAQTGAPCSLKQSVMRNIVILAPFAVLQLVTLLLTFIQISWLNEAIKNLMQVIGAAYVAIVLPMEAYRAYNRDDSLRFGDQFAGTTIVEATMDFTNPLSK